MTSKFMTLMFLFLISLFPALCKTSLAETASSPQVAEQVAVQALEVEAQEPSILSRFADSGPVVFLVLLILIFLSILVWGVLATKLFYLRKVAKTSDVFIKGFWDSRSLNELNSHLGDYPYSPAREIFRSGYAELVRGSQLKEQQGASDLAVKAVLDNLTRTLMKSKNHEKKNLERFLMVLSITASTSPFIGLFGTVWGIMGAFEGIARTGNASLSAVAPGISEALIATAFGLAAAIPAVVGYNMSVGKIRRMLSSLDGFGVDFLNIVQRYLVSDRSRAASPSTQVQTPRI